VLASSDENIVQMLEFARSEIKVITLRYGWKVLQKEHLITLQAGVSRYPVPLDFRRWLGLTGWDRGEQTRLIGPLTPEQYQRRASGLIDVVVDTEYRLVGTDSIGIQILPTPDAGKAGQVLVLEYVSQEAIHPRPWVPSTFYALGEKAYSNGNIYTSEGNGTSGNAAPIHTSGTFTDNSSDWTFSAMPYLDFTSDEDVFLLDEYLIQLGIKYRWYRENGHTFEPALQEYKSYFSDVAGAAEGASALRLDMPYCARQNGYYPPSAETGYGVE
jgi:hypothetical protein